MATWNITKKITDPGDNLIHLGARMDVIVDIDTPGESSSVINIPEMSSSSSSQESIDYSAVFLYRRVNDDDTFLDVCSPADMETWPSDNPDAATGLYRSNQVSITFRSRTLLEQAYEEVWKRIEALGDALTILSRMRITETVPYDFSENDAEYSSSSGDGIRRFTLTRDAFIPYPTSSPTGYLLRITCDADGVDDAIFLWRNDLPDRTNTVQKRPIAVCSPGDLVDYPEGTPDVSQFPAHYRLNEWSITSARLSLLEETWTKIKSDVSQLARALNAHLGQATEVETPSKDYHV